MTVKRKRCAFCGRWFRPHPRTWQHQKACSMPRCRKERRSRANRCFRARNAGYDKGRREKIKVWAKEYPRYWRQYRRTHGEYRQRDNRRRWRARQKVKCAAKQDAIREISLQKLRVVQGEVAHHAAKQDAIWRATEGLLGYLFWKEGAAKQDGMVLGPSPG